MIKEWMDWMRKFSVCFSHAHISHALRDVEVPMETGVSINIEISSF